MNAPFKKFAATLIATSALFAGAALAQSAPTIDTSEDTNIRSGPGFQYTVRAVQDGTFTITGRTEFDLDGTCLTTDTGAAAWVRISFGGGEGWLNRCVGTVDGDLSGVPVVEAANPVVIVDRATRVASVSGDLLLDNTEGVIAYVTARVANVRENPSVNSTRIGALARPEEGDTTVYVIGRNEAGTWARVTFNNGTEVITGWVARFLLQLPRDWKDNVDVQ